MEILGYVCIGIVGISLIFLFSELCKDAIDGKAELRNLRAELEKAWTEIYKQETALTPIRVRISVLESENQSKKRSKK